jgi:MFS transporter, SHS family, lactate transporter
MRPVGAMIFGWWADHRGRRIPLLTDVALYSLVGFACAFAPNFAVLLVLRLLYGIGMGGEWGLGAALAMEKLPVDGRGFFSGVLQQGYALGALLATGAYLLISNFTAWGWRGLFAFSLLPALLSLALRSRVRESQTWRETRARRVSPARILFSGPVLRQMLYLVALMTAFNWVSHSSQDIYPTFLRAGLHFPANAALLITILYNIGALIGGSLMGAVSERLGRRRTIILCAVIGLPIIPLFALSTAIGVVCAGSFLMQMTIQGAWGVIPAHLAEISPDEIRGFYPGVTYQVGNCLAAASLPLQQALAKSHGYGFALCITLVPGFCAIIVLSAIGGESKGVIFGCPLDHAGDRLRAAHGEPPEAARDRQLRPEATDYPSTRHAVLDPRQAHHGPPRR